VTLTNGEFVVVGGPSANSEAPGITAGNNINVKDTSLTFDPLAAGVISGNTITTPFAHGFQNGDAVVYRADGGLPIAGLTDGQTYYVVNATTTTLQLALSPGGSAIPISCNGVTCTGHTHMLDRPNLIALMGFTDLADGGTGWIDVDTNGSVDIKEVSGDLR